MGSFNTNGCFSNIPISYSDDVVALIGFRVNAIKDQFAPGNSFTPVMLPVYGKYSDCSTIEVEETEAIKFISDKIGMSVDELIEMIVREELSASDFLGYFNKEVPSNYRTKQEPVLDVLYEHKFYWDKLVSMTNKSRAEHEFFWRIPVEEILNLGYVKTAEYPKEHGYEIEDYERDGSPKLKRNCYWWTENFYKDYGHVLHSIKALAEECNVVLGLEMNESFYEYCFKRSMRIYNECLEEQKEEVVDDVKEEVSDTKAKLTEEEIDKMLSDILNNTTESTEDIKNFVKSFKDSNKGFNHWSLDEKLGSSEYPNFIRSAYGSHQQSWFHTNEYYNTSYLLCVYDNSELLVEHNMHSAVELMSVMNAMSILNVCWGNSHYVSEEVKMDNYLELNKLCVEFIENKLKRINED